jgi:cell division protein FtsN
MAEYQLTETDTVLRTADEAWIPNDPSNRDRVEYEQWLADGGVPDPYVPPTTAPPEPTPEQRILLDHENRIRVQEGVPPLTIGDLLAKML